MRPGRRVGQVPSKPAKTAAKPKKASPRKPAKAAPSAPQAKPKVAASPAAPAPLSIPAPGWVEVAAPAPMSAWTLSPPVSAPQLLQPTRGLADLLPLLLAATVGLSAVSLLLQLLLPDWGMPDASTGLVLGQGLFSLVSGGVSIALVIVFCMWLYRTLTNAKQRHPAAAIKPGWAVGSLFVPFAHFVVPYFEVRRGWQAQVSPDSGPLAAWFVPWSLALAVGYVSGVLAGVISFRGALSAGLNGQTADLGAVYDDLRPWMLAVGAVSLVLNGLAAFFLTRVVRQWTALQEERPVS